MDIPRPRMPAGISSDQHQASSLPTRSTFPGSIEDPGSPFPRNTLPGSQFPGNTLPGSPFPGTTLPGSQFPGNTLPGSQCPANTLPGSPFPGNTLPGSPFQGNTLPGSPLFGPLHRHLSGSPIQHNFPNGFPPAMMIPTSASSLLADNPFPPLKVPPMPAFGTPPSFPVQADSSGVQQPQDRMSSGGSNGAGGSGSRLPIFKDDLSFNDRRGRSLFDDMQRQMDEDFGNMSLRSGLRRNKLLGRDWDDDPFKDFFELRPRNPKLSKISRDDTSSRESLDDSTTKTLFLEDPSTKTRMFQMSFNVQDYSPEDISVKVVDDSLLVEAKHSDDQSTREFSRKIAIPKEVDPDKLSSTMSNDGILTIKAPVPPKYQSISGPGGQSAGVINPISSAPEYTPSASSASYTGHHGTSYPQPPYSPPPAPQYQDAHSYPTSYPSASSAHAPYPSVSSAHTPHSSYYAPPPSTQPRMSTQMQPPGPMSPPPPFTQAHTMTSPAPNVIYYTHQPPPQHQSYQHQDFPPPPPPQAHMFPAPPMASPPLPQEFPAPPPPQPTTLDIPSYTDTPTGRRMDLTLFLGPPYTPEDILVKVDGKTLVIEACHTEKKDKKTSKASMSREFELSEDINPQTVQANLTNDGHLKLAAMVPVPGEDGGDDEGGENGGGQGEGDTQQAVSSAQN